MLIALQQRLAGREDDEFLHPVPGRPGDTQPTTGDVHLYPDPATQWTSTPLLFADCEGLDGGDRTPTALKANEAGGYGQFRSFRQRLRQGISWANGSKQSKREEVVTNLFPKILYTVSDVVVFTLKEARYEVTTSLTTSIPPFRCSPFSRSD